MKKTLILLAALALTSAGTAFAQAPVTTTGTNANQTALHQNLAKKSKKTPEQKADRHASKMAKELGLNADQETRVEQLLLARHQETAAFKAKYGDDKKAGRPEMKAAHERYEVQLKQILTPEQYAKFQQKKDEQRDHNKMKDGGKMKVKTKA